MKAIKFIFVALLAMSLASCKKETTNTPKPPVTVPVEFPATIYTFLGTFDSLGKPDYLLPKDPISANLFSFLNSILTDGRDLRTFRPELLSNPEIADIEISQPSEVFITFLRQGAEQTNALGFYTYATNNPPTTAKDLKVIAYVFPNAGKLTPLRAGDKVKIGNFEAGTSIGFVLLQSAWSPATGTLNNKSIHYCSTDALNPEVSPALKKHAVLFKYAPETKIIVSFEDSDRTHPNCDNDFNDVEFYCTITV
ncbi:MAG: DUF4114 domain-containing protein [Ginsengibacter sp.]